MFSEKTSALAEAGTTLAGGGSAGTVIRLVALLVVSPRPASSQPSALALGQVRPVLLRRSVIGTAGTAGIVTVTVRTTALLPTRHQPLVRLLTDTLRNPEHFNSLLASNKKLKRRHDRVTPPLALFPPWAPGRACGHGFRGYAPSDAGSHRRGQAQLKLRSGRNAPIGRNTNHH